MIKNLLASIAAAGLAVAPVAAQAGTRAADSGVSMDALSSLQRVSSPIRSSEKADGGLPVPLIILLFGAAGAGLILAIEGGENNKSPGT